jgi:hypothetical protein
LTLLKNKRRKVGVWWELATRTKVPWRNHVYLGEFRPNCFKESCFPWEQGPFALNSHLSLGPLYNPNSIVMGPSCFPMDPSYLGQPCYHEEHGETMFALENLGPFTLEYHYFPKNLGPFASRTHVSWVNWMGNSIVMGSSCSKQSCSPKETWTNHS